MRKSFKICAGGKEYGLRLTLGGQKELKAIHNTDALSVCFDALSNAESMEDLLRVSLNWDGNQNGGITGEELYNALVDDGKCGQSEWTQVVTGIAEASGLITSGQATAMRKRAAAAEQKMLQNLEADEAEETAAENPENPM